MCQQTLGRRVMRDELTHFLRWMTSWQFEVLPQISHWSHQFPAHPAQKKLCRVIIYVHECTIQGLVFNWFSWNSHAWCGSTHGWTLLFLEIIGPTEPLIWRKMCPQIHFFSFHSASMEFFMEKIVTVHIETRNLSKIKIVDNCEMTFQMAITSQWVIHLLWNLVRHWREC